MKEDNVLMPMQLFLLMTTVHEAVLNCVISPSLTKMVTIKYHLED